MRGTEPSSKQDLREIVSKLAHDLRSPLNLVVGYADLLAAESAGSLTVKQRQFVEQIRTGASTIQNTIAALQREFENSRSGSHQERSVEGGGPRYES